MSPVPIRTSGSSVVDVDHRNGAGGIRSGECRVDVGNGIALCYERLGDPTAEPLLLIAGLGQQLHTWPDGFCDGLVDRGFHVIRFDNRDCGCSTHMNFPPPNPIAMLRGRARPEQYRLTDMARDTVGLLDALEIDSAHVVGASMGGMIAQTLAAQHPARVRSLTSMMSNTGAAKVGRPAFSTWVRMAGRPARGRDEAVERSVRLFRHIGSYGFPFDEDWVRETAARAFDREPDARGVARQLAAIFASGDRTVECGRIKAPTVVVHGDRDRMVNPSGGLATVQAIPGARLRTIVGMGHDLPAGAWPQVIDVIADNAARWRPSDQSQRSGSANAQIPA